MHPNDQDYLKYLDMHHDGSQVLRLVRNRLEHLLLAIEKHRDAKGHDRCWENDLELYAVLGEKLPSSPELPPQCEFQQKCKEYYFQQLSVKGKPVESTDKPWFPQEG